MSSNKVALKFIYSEKATKFCEIFALLIDLLLSYIVPVKSKVKISQNFVAFSEYMNFKEECFDSVPAKIWWGYWPFVITPGPTGFREIEPRELKKKHPLHPS